MIKRDHRSKVIVIASLAVLVLFTSLPQFYLWYVRGSDWNGSCAYLDTDELAYAAYTNALIDGRPRRNDPYTGKDNSQYEGLFSIQFFPAYFLALPGRIFGISANTTFIILLPLATVSAALAVLWLLYELTQNFSLAIAGTFGVLCFGYVVAFNPLHLLISAEAGYDGFPFIRRYVPALAFPVFLMSTVFMWRALTRSAAWAILAGVSFAILVFSYFFLWTAAGAWFCTLVVLWLLARPQDRTRTWRVAGIMTVAGTCALLPYSWLLMHRASSIDQVQVLQVTHSPDLLRMPELYGLCLICAVAFHVKKGGGSLRNPGILFLLSFALAPLLVFNQQILSGHSLQPFHYEEFIANYWVLIGLFLALGIMRQDLPKRIAVYLVCGAMVSGAWLGVRTARDAQSMNIHLDEVRAVALKLRNENSHGVVFASDALLTNTLPSSAPNPVLWARYLKVFSNPSLADQKKRFFQYLYYSGFDGTQLPKRLQTDFTSRWEIFGADRANSVLTIRHNPITEGDIEEATREYAEFTRSFDATLAEDPVLSYAVVSSNDNLANLDRWYIRSSPERTGDFTIYRLALRSAR